MKPPRQEIVERDERAEIRLLAENLIHELEQQRARLGELEKRQPGKASQAPVLTEARRLLARLSPRSGDTILFERQRIRDGALDEEYFRRELAPGLVTFEGVVTEQRRAGTDAHVMTFPAVAAADNRFAVRHVAARDLWVRTRPRINVWFSSPVGSTNTFSFRFVLRAFGQGSGMTGFVVVTDWTPAGPAVANTVQYTTVTTGAVFPSSPSGVVQLRLGRLGGDANANDLDILLAQIVFEEVA